MQIDIKLVNKILSNLEYPKAAGLIMEEKITAINAIGDHNDWEGDQGSFNEYHTFYTHPELEGVVVKFVGRTDSYGSGNEMVSIEFGKGVPKQVVKFEAIK